MFAADGNAREVVALLLEHQVGPFGTRRALFLSREPIWHLDEMKNKAFFMHFPYASFELERSLRSKMLYYVIF